MCEMCIEHGEGKKWYLQAKNFTEELYHDAFNKGLTTFAEGCEADEPSNWGLIGMLVEADPSKSFFPDMEREGRKAVMMQVVPLEDVDQILDMSMGIFRQPCLCRSATLGQTNARFHYGLVGFKTEPNQIAESRYTEFSINPGFSSDLEMLTREEAKAHFRELEDLGCLHSVGSYQPPLISSICNCTRQDCIGLGTRHRLGLKVYFKSEYVADIDIEKCNGCRECRKQCNFGAIGYSPALEKCYIHQFECYGCGICRAVCPTGAISLFDRNKMPELAKEW
jgi:Pyruvate/2-oxoacid:ferredoxin oxidoreductase delta subunit